jgi:hypothetical protein
MARLLAEEDYRFVLTSSKSDVALARRLRQERRRVFRSYVSSLKRDFGRVSVVLSAIIAHADEDRSQLNVVLTKHRLAFRWALLRIEVLLALHAVGCSPTVDVRALVGCFDALRVEMRSALAEPAAG